MTHSPLPAAYFDSGSASFVEFVRATHPHLLGDLRADIAGAGDVSPHATTIVALVFDGGVLMAGDRRATIGSLIAHREMEKVFSVDDTAMIGIAGAAGIALDLVRVFQLEVEHFEKIEGANLSTEGKANRLGSLLRQNLPLALQGLAALPLFAGFDGHHASIFSYDVTGGRYRERDYYAVGSGGSFARSALKKSWRPGLAMPEAVAAALAALADASDDDTGTGGPDLIKRIWPVVAVIDAGGYRRIDDATLSAAAQESVERIDPGGDSA
ncbi:proteasome subunit beta [Rarobacter faecitabidus]|uniref:Proteasome subunit beta n=1 Tax=Rarobacter faecitabidus TaxID=13243 RepID=A0A542ZVN6_RARFA|nr:proteasome subunit beta [Rarobacter faecitabidus]TQL64427.1 proteasome endopeptidase complex beta subunit [Rarobacter faecitabidus]